MPKQSKFFRVAVEGDTVDGRTIERNWLVEMAASYNPATYAARVNMEHIRGITADKPFKAYGDVIALKTDDVEVQIGGKTVKKLGLFAQIDPTDDLVQINSDRQKLYTSVEINPNFANSGKAYLMGLAVTDSPASLATEALQFVAHRKQAPTNHFSAAQETTIEFVEADAPKDPASAGLFAAATEFFKQFTKPTAAEPPKEEPKPAPEEAANDNFAALKAAIADGMGKFTQAVEALSAETKGELAKLRTDYDALKASIETTDASNTKRPAATGGGNFVVTDC